MSSSTVQPILEVQGLTRYFGGLLAVDQVSLLFKIKKYSV